MKHLSQLFIDVINDDDLAGQWIDKDKIYPMPEFKKGKHAYTIPIVHPAEVYYKNNPCGGGFMAHVKFRFLKEEDHEEDILSRFLNNNCKLSFAVTVGMEKYILHTEQFTSGIKLLSSPNSEYVSVHATVGPMRYTHCRMDLNEIMN